MSELVSMGYNRTDKCFRPDDAGFPRPVPLELITDETEWFNRKSTHSSWLTGVLYGVGRRDTGVLPDGVTANF